jgi:hypothetical protein
VYPVKKLEDEKAKEKKFNREFNKSYTNRAKAPYGIFTIDWKIRTPNRRPSYLYDFSRLIQNILQKFLFYEKLGLLIYLGNSRYQKHLEQKLIKGIHHGSNYP